MLDPRWGPLTEDRLTRDLTIVQRARGHRFSSDDMATAYVACRRAPDARRILDLGCGIGSVLLHLAWSLPAATLVGIEAQAVSFALLTENVRRNQLGARVAIHHGDLRELWVGLFSGHRHAAVLSRTPRSTPRTSSGPTRASSTAAASTPTPRRGGAAPARWFLCGDARTEAGCRPPPPGRPARRPHRRAHAPKPPLFAVWTLAHAAAPLATDELVLRDAAGRTTPDAARLRAFSGF
jgi:hypothetical protein